ncbi:hypothetical protein PAXRUDRAFT_399036 [Paxillus rubicundulus Ve08.2h10]|uniref:B-related factor 1 n=1 Tax=Paxillus rubicundulus Ve08.2h10 TaxID=930991 RepID=A0A0D0DD97_9AGAM|nr:hypothetical protein PAXRUDRAFT_399036 [Paxillus rubicundulus Ve08.2h10]
MVMACPDCGGEYVLHEQVGSSICTQCGTLADPAQCILASHIENHNSTSTYPATSWISSTTHTAVRNKNGWNLAGHTKEARDRKNTMAMSTFINSVLLRLNNPGLSPRAEAIFTQAMSKGQYRWGRKAKLAAGASIAIALRDAHKSDSLRDIAFLLDDSPVSLTRAFQSVVSLLNFNLSSTDPAVHIPILQAHLQSTLHPESVSTPPPSQLPASLVSILTHLSLPTAAQTAASLSEIISDRTPALPLSQLPTPATACALFILGLEAETRTPLPHLGELARSLASRLGLSGGVVTSRYKIVYDLIEEWIRQVPWLDQFVCKGKGRGSSARSKVPKRAIVAKGVKDVIQFQEEIWAKRKQTQQKINLTLEPDPAEEYNADESCGFDASKISSSSKNIEESDKKTQIKRGTIHEAYQLLLDPLSSSISSTSRNKASSTLATSTYEISMLTHMLTCPADELSRRTARTRLQLLAASRGGSALENIADEELFDGGELEGLLRSEQEREALQPLFELNWGKGTSEDDDPLVSCPKPVGTAVKRGAKRVNMDVLARILGEDADDGEKEEPELPDSDKRDDLHHWDLLPMPSQQISLMEGAESISDWRPLSPGDSGRYCDTVEDMYEEEY